MIHFDRWYDHISSAMSQLLPGSTPIWRDRPNGRKVKDLNNAEVEAIYKTYREP